MRLLNIALHCYTLTYRCQHARVRKWWWSSFVAASTKRESLLWESVTSKKLQRYCLKTLPFLLKMLAAKTFDTIVSLEVTYIKHKTEVCCKNTLTPFSAIYDTFSRCIQNNLTPSNTIYAAYFTDKNLRDCWLLCRRYLIECLLLCLHCVQILATFGCFVQDTSQILDTFGCLPTEGVGHIDWRTLRWPPIRIMVISINPTELYSTALLYGATYMAQ